LQTKEIGEYLIFRLRAAGYFGPHLFSGAAISKIASSAEGLVRRVNILADKSLLAAFAENEYQVTPNHVQAAIADSEFGVEKSKQQAKQSQVLMWAALLALGLALGYTVSMWAQRSNSLAKPPEIAVTPEGAMTRLQPNVGESASNAKPNDTKLSEMQKTTPVAAAVTPSTTSNLQEDILTRRLNATSVWLANQAPSTVSIQLMGASSDVQLKNDLEVLGQQMELDNIYVYRTKVNNQPFLTVLYGSFANRFEATQALQKLPAELQKNRPQLRTIAGVLQETK
jgi:septal ring-binding cell division protein DamX